MYDTESDKKHWSEIDRSAPCSMPPPSVCGPQRHWSKSFGRRWQRLILIGAVGVIAVGLMTYFSVEYSRAVASERESVQALDVQRLQVKTATLAEKHNPQRTAALTAAVTERVVAWNVLLESIAATGDDKTDELAAFLDGSTEQVREAATAYQARWAAGGVGDDGAVVVPGSMTIAKVELGPEDRLAGVLITEEVRLSDGTKVRCLENTVWSMTGDTWLRAVWTGSYWYGGNGRRQIEQGVQVDGVAWCVEKIQENPASETKGATGCVITVTFDARNQDLVTHTPADYVLSLFTPDGVRHDVSTLTDTLSPGVSESMQPALIRDEERTFAVVFEVPAGTDLTTLQFEVSPGSGAASSDAGNAPFIQAGTPRAWALATSALLAHLSGKRDDLLAGVPVATEYIAYEQQGLEQWWDIFNRDDLHQALEWIDQEGHRAVWEEMAADLVPMSEKQVQRVLDAYANDPEMQRRIELVREYAPQFGSKSLLGWDYCRYVFLCRSGYLCGYLTEDEAWDLIMPVAAKLQATFSSWAELGQNYLVGREFWSYEETQKTGDEMQSIYEDLLSSSFSPWTLNPWDLDLGVAVSGSL